MNRIVLPLAVAAAAVTLSGCDQSGQKANEPGAAQSGEAKKAAGGETIAAGLDQNGRFFQAAKSAGLDATLAGPGPYTVLVPDDAAFAKLPKETADSWAKPESRAQLTGVLTYHILPGTILADDIGKAIDNGKGKAVLATMGGGILTATKDGAKTVLTDAAGHKATITKGDEQFTNGVVHHVDALLLPSRPANGAAVGEKKGK